MLLRAVTAWVALGLLPGAAPARDRWITLSTDHLTIISNAGDSEAREVARRLEDFVAALSIFPGRRIIAEVPVTVFAFRNGGSFGAFRPLQDGRTVDVAGYFQRADDEHLIALNLDASVEYPYRVIFHEYEHALTAQASMVWPLWLSEGLAEFYSTFEVRGRRVEAGQPIRYYTQVLAEQSLLSIDALFSVDRSSSLYVENSRNIFYAQSWALVHWLMDQGGARPGGALFRFIDELGAGRPPEAALEAALGLDHAKLDQSLRGYVRQAWYPPHRFELDGRRIVATAVRELGAAEADVLRGSLLMRIGRGVEADPYLTRAAAVDPRAPRLEESRGFLALNRGQYADAIAYLSRAIAEEPANALAHYYYAETLRRQVTEQGRQLTPAVAGAMFDPLRTAVRLRPDFARAHYVLGYVHLVMGADLQEGIREVETAIRLAPPNRAAMLTLASIQLKMKNYDAARATAQALLDAPDASESIKAEAQQVLRAASDHM